MKKNIYLIVFALIFVLSASAQTDETRNIKKFASQTVESTTHGVYKKIFQKNKLDLLRADHIAGPDSTITYRIDGSIYNQYYYTYKNGLVEMDKYFYYNAEDGSLDFAYYSTYEYDSSGREIKSLGYSFEDGIWKHTNTSETSYSSSGYTISSYGEDLTRPSWIKVCEIEQKIPLADGRYIELTAWTEYLDLRESGTYQLTKYVGVGIDGWGIYTYWDIEDNYAVEIEYDSKGRMKKLDDYVFTYDSKNQLISAKSNYRDVTFTYDSKGNVEIFDIKTFKEDKWQDFNKQVYEYNQQGKLASYARFIPEGSNVGDFKWIYNYGSQDYSTMYQRYARIDNRWLLIDYTVSYPNDKLSDLEIDSSNSVVGSDNKGSFDIGLTLPSDATIKEGSFELVLPEGMNIDKEETKLNGEIFLDNGRVIIYSKDWDLGYGSFVKSSSGELEYKKIITIVYTIDKEVEQGTYTAFLRSVNFELGDGIRIIEENIPVTIEVERSSTDNQSINEPQVEVYLQGNQVTVISDISEIIDVYTISGQKLYSTSKTGSECMFRIPALSKSVIILTGSSGWTKKLLLENQ